jgi:hypothetical protein
MKVYVFVKSFAVSTSTTVKVFKDEERAIAHMQEELNYYTSKGHTTQELMSASQWLVSLKDDCMLMKIRTDFLE